MQFTDKTTQAKTQRTITKDGFLVVPATISKVGVFDYLASELGLKEDGIKKVARTEKSLFSDETIESFENATLTIGHPEQGVNAKNWKELSVGVVRNVKRVGDELTAEAWIYDEQAIKTVQEHGVEQLSCGYDCNIIQSSVKDADFEMSPMIGNHVAIVAKGRCGGTVKLADEERTVMGKTAKFLDAFLGAFGIKLSDEQKKQIEEEIIETGKRTTIDLGIHGLHPELIRIIGKMKYRSSYGQNLLQHARETANLCAVMASELGLNPKKAKRAGLLHDIGKTKIPNELLNKAGKLTDEEFLLMKQHALFGYSILKDKKELSDPVLMGVLQHHEKLNGKGYPLGVPEEKIYEYAKIISTADIYDALVTERPYKKAFSPRAAVEMIMAMTDELDINVMRSFLDSIILYPVGSTVQLSNGENAKVIENNPKYVLRPKVFGLKTGKVYDLGNDLKCANIIIK